MVDVLFICDPNRVDRDEPLLISRFGESDAPLVQEVLSRKITAANRIWGLSF